MCALSRLSFECAENRLDVHTVVSSHDKKISLMRKLNIMAEEMESAELYTLDALKGVETLALFIVSDNILTRESTSSKEREKSFNDIISVALDSFINFCLEI